MITRFTAYLYSICLLVFVINDLKGQDKITSSQFFLRVLIDPKLDMYEGKMNYLENTSHRLPVLEEINLRTETDEFRPTKQEYTARFEFNSRAARQAQNRFHQSTIFKEKAEINNIFLDNLSRKYQLWTEYHFYKNEKDIQNEKLAVLKDKLKVIGILAKTTGKYDVADLIRIEEDLDKLEQRIFELDSRMNYYSKLVAQTLKTNESIVLDNSNFITLKTLKQTVKSLLLIENTHPDLNIIAKETNQIQAEIALEKANSKKILDFVQFKYGGTDKDVPHVQEWSLGVGLKIPVKNSDILDIRSLELEELESKNELKIRSIELRKRIEDRNAKIQMLFRERDLLAKQLKEYQENYDLEHYAKTGTDPLVLLKIKEIELQKKRAILTIEKDIYFYYLDILELTGKMSEMPFVNYLSEDLHIFFSETID